MGQSNARQNAIAAITAWPTTGVRVNASETPVRQLFGVNVFSDEVMRSRLPGGHVYQGPPGDDQEEGPRSTRPSPTWWPRR